MYDDNASEGPKGTFEIYRAEAESLYKQGEYRKAIDSFTTALELHEGDRNCLVARSKCHLQLGDMQSALLDAEESLKEDNLYHKGIYQKAQALYYMGDFEMALVFYHRGLKLRPELQEFRLGIQKAQEAIDNSVGCKLTRALFADVSDTPSSKKNVSNTSCPLFKQTSDWTLDKIFPSFYKTSTSKHTSSHLTHTSQGAKAPETVKLTTEGDLSYFEQQLDEKKMKRKGKTYGRPVMQQPKSSSRVPAGSEKTIKQLLGELYGDRQYLEKLLKETDPNSDMGKTISSLVSEGLSYLDTRSDFWRQQKPMYARRHDRLMQRKKREVSSTKLLPSDYILKELERIDQAQADGRYQEALKRSQKCLTTVQGYSDEDVPNKAEVLSNIHSCLGNAYLELGSYDKSLDHHQTDLSLGETHDMLEAVSRALDNVGRVYARKGEFDSAISIWERKLPMTRSSLESTWLFHEIGRCHLELGQLKQAKDYGLKSESAALDANDQMWHLQASVLIAQTEVKLNELQAGVSSFEKALELAKAQGDKSAENAIQRAIEDVNTRILAGEGVTSQEEESGNTNNNETAGNRTGSEQQEDQRSDAHVEKVETTEKQESNTNQQEDTVSQKQGEKEAEPTGAKTLNNPAPNSEGDTPPDNSTNKDA